MAIIVPSRRVWTRQPQHNAPLNAASPLTRGLGTLVVGGQHQERTTGRMLSRLFGTTATIETRAGASGAGWYVTQQSDSGRIGWDYGKEGPTTADRVSVFAGWVDSLPAFDGTFYGSGPAVDQYSARSSIGLSRTSGVTRWRAMFRDGGGSVRFLVGTSAVVAGAPAVVILRESQTQGFHQLWVNGVLEAETTAYTFQGGARLRYYLLSVTTGYLSTALTGYWTRDLSESEIVAVSRNPWSLFAPQSSPIFYSLPAAGGSGIPVLSLPGVQSITATGATPKVTLTFS